MAEILLAAIDEYQILMRARGAEPVAAPQPRRTRDTYAISVSGALVEMESRAERYRNWGIAATSYEGLLRDIQAAESDPEVSQVVFEVNSPGGAVQGLSDVTEAIRTMAKPKRAEVERMALSAGYAIAAATGEIVALSDYAEFGSIGVAVDTYAYPEDISIASTDAPKKRPDIRTEEGRDVVRERLDQTHALFVRDISAGLGVSVEKINKDFGQGGVLLAERALEAGMISSVVTTGKKPTPQPTSGGGKKIGAKMTLEELQAAHPGLYAQCVALGVSQERERVDAHLLSGEASGGMEIAVRCIRDGSQFGAKIQAEYLAAGLRKQQISARAADDEAADAASNAPAPAAGAQEAHDAELLALVRGGLK